MQTTLNRPQMPSNDVRFGARRVSKGNMGKAPVSGPSVSGPAATGGPISPQYTQAMKDLSFKLFEQARKGGVKNTNTVFSPVSIGLAMSMVLNGTTGDTTTDTQKALQMSGLNIADINNATQGYTKLLTGTDPKVKVEIANAVWASKNYPLQKTFIDNMKKAFDAEVANLDYSNPQHAMDVINKHIAKKTNNLIPKMLDDIDPNTIASIVNTTYLKADWAIPFEAEDNFTDKFTTTAGKQKDVNFMSRTGQFQYVDNAKDGFEAIKLPYGQNKEMSMVVLLPKAGNSLENLSGKLNSKNWTSWSDQLKNKPFTMGQLDLPKHEVEFSLDGKEALEGLGMSKLFDPKEADLTTMFGFKKPYVSEVKHKAVMKVNEKGTEAAAATYVGFALESCIMKPTPNFHMKANHGFITVIQDEKTNTPLFITTVDNPDFIPTTKDKN